MNKVLYTEAWYIKNVRQYERKLMLWNVIHEFFSILTVLSGAVMLWMMTVIDDQEHVKLIWSTIAVSILVFCVSVLMAKMQKPKVPVALMIYKNRHVISSALNLTLRPLEPRPLLDNHPDEDDSSPIVSQSVESATVYLHPW